MARFTYTMNVAIWLMLMVSVWIPALGQEADPCCLTMQYQGYITEHATEGDMSGADPVQYIHLYQFYADHDRGQITVNYTDGNRPDDTEMAYFDYNTKTVYYLHTNGSCSSQTTIKGMRKPCEYEGGRVAFFQLGLEFRDTRMAFSNLEELTDDSKKFQQYDVWDFSCGLLHSSTFVYEKGTNRYGFYAHSYANMNSNPPDPSYFDIPPECLAA